jgi:hypothetical protein
MSVTDCLFFFLHFFGGILICVGLFLHEDEEGKFQNKIEEWWIKLSDKQNASRSRVATFMREVAESTGRGFDRLFGSRLFSLRVIPVSIYLSFASFFLLVLLIFPRLKNIGEVTRQGAFLMFLLFLGLSLAPALFNNKWVLSLWWVIIPGVLLGLSGFIVFVFKTRGPRYAFKGIGLVALIFVASLLCDLIYIALTRYILRRISAIDHIPEILLMTFLNLLALAIPLLGPFYGGLAFAKYAPQVGAAIVFSILFNSINILVGTAALFLALLLLLHRLFWPAVQRPLYAIYRFAPIKEKEVVVQDWRCPSLPS